VWPSILDGSAREQALEAVAAIAADLRDAQSEGAWADRATFFAYRHRAVGDQADARLAEALLDRAMDEVAEVPMTPALFGGFVGTAWTVAHLAGDDHSDDPLEEIDALLIDRLSTDGDGPYDLIGGVAGLGTYALERLARPSGATLLDLALARLGARATPRPGGIAWHTPPHLLHPEKRPRHPRGYFDVGVAHGAAGVIALLGAAYRAGRPSAGALLEGAVPWLIAQRTDDGFPAFVGDGPSSAARTAWCYGDAGNAAALLCAASGTNRADWRDAALRIAREASMRAPDQAGVADAALCHGAAGLALLYHQFYALTDEARFADAARAYYQCVLDRRRPGEGAGGFFSFRKLPGSSGGELVADRTLLEGSSGIGLALLAGAVGGVPRWLRRLLVWIE